MSRNLGHVDCHYCSGDVKLLELLHPIMVADAGGHFQEYSGMLVANAACEDCEACYLAWVREAGSLTQRRTTDGEFFDLSFLSTFNDEPGPADVPKWKITRQVVTTREPWPGSSPAMKPVTSGSPHQND